MYQIYWTTNEGIKQCLNLNCPEDVKNDIMDSLKNYKPVCFDRSTEVQRETVQTINKDHKPIVRGVRYLTAQATFGLKATGETLYTYMIPDLGIDYGEYVSKKWVSERDGKQVEVIGLVWRTVDEIRKVCDKYKIKKLVWLKPIQEDNEPL